MNSPIIIPGMGRQLRSLTLREIQLSKQVSALLKDTNMEEASTVLTQLLVRSLQTVGCTRDRFVETILSIWDAVKKGEG